MNNRKKVVLFSTYLLEEQKGYLFDKRGDKFSFSLDFFKTLEKSPDVLDFLLDDPLTLKICSDYFAMMEWKTELIKNHLWKEKFESAFLKDELDQIADYYQDNETIYNQLMDYADNHLGPVLALSAEEIDKNKIKRKISSIENDVAKQECQRFANGVLNMYWGKKPAPKLPLLHRRFSLYMLNNVDDTMDGTDYATYAVWSLRENVDNDTNLKRWCDVLIQEIIKRHNNACDEIILAIHDRDAGRVVPFEILELKKKFRETDVYYSVVLFDHTNSRIHPLLREHKSCKEIYYEIKELIES